MIATPHIGGSTEEAQEIVGVRIAEQVRGIFAERRRDECREHAGMTPEQFKTLGPFGVLAERLGSFASHISKGNPQTVR